MKAAYLNCEELLTLKGSLVTASGGAGHLFENPRELEGIADRAGQWFTTRLA